MNIEQDTIFQQSSSRVRTTILSFLLLLSVVVMMTISTQDIDLLLFEQTNLSLPLINTQVPLKAFYIFAPLVCLLFHLHLLVNLSHHAEKIAKRIGEGDEEKNNQSIASLAPALFDYYFVIKKGDDHYLLTRIAVGLLIFVLCPLVLFVVLFRFTDYQSVGYSLWHFFCLLISLTFAFITSEKIEKQRDPSDKKSIIGGRLVICGIGLGGAFWFAIVLITVSLSTLLYGNKPKLNNEFVQWVVKKPLPPLLKCHLSFKP